MYGLRETYANRSIVTVLTLIIGLFGNPPLTLAHTLPSHIHTLYSWSVGKAKKSFKALEFPLASIKAWFSLRVTVAEILLSQTPVVRAHMLSILCTCVLNYALGLIEYF